MIWRPYSDKYISGQEAVQGKYVIFRVYNDGSTSKINPKKYRLDCKLPGIKDYLGHFETGVKQSNMPTACSKDG